MNPAEGNPPAPRFASAGREYIFHILLTLSLFLSITFIPLAGFLTGVLTPLPTTLALIRIGPPGALFVPGIAGIAGGIVLFWLDMAHAIPYFCALLGMGMVLGYGTRKMWASEKVIGLSCLVVMTMSAVLVVFTYFETQGQLVGLLEQDLRTAISAALTQFGTPSPETREMEASLLATVPLMVRIMPGITLACTLGISWVNMLVARRYCRGAGFSEFIPEDLTLWKAPEALVWVLIASGLTLIAQVDGLKFVALNALVVLGSVYFLQGLAVASFYLGKWKLSPVFRGLIYAILVMQQIASMAIAVVGLFDMWFDFRKLTKKPD